MSVSLLLMFAVCLAQWYGEGTCAHVVLLLLLQFPLSVEPTRVCLVQLGRTNVVEVSHETAKGQEHTRPHIQHLFHRQVGVVLRDDDRQQIEEEKEVCREPQKFLSCPFSTLATYTCYTSKKELGAPPKKELSRPKANQGAASLPPPIHFFSCRASLNLRKRRALITSSHADQLPLPALKSETRPPA